MEWITSTSLAIYEWLGSAPIFIQVAAGMLIALLARAVFHLCVFSLDYYMHKRQLKAVITGMEIIHATLKETNSHLDLIELRLTQNRDV